MDEAQFAQFCPYYHEAVELIGRRWAGVIVRALLGGATRFSDIARAVPDLSDRLLSERLKELETAGVLDRRVVPETPVRVEYHLTGKGRELAPVVEAISRWADRWVAPADHAPEIAD
ncbi:MAG: helix-turn-helix transcriptional regulator [Dehalococcoidia bacterium]|nr:helix-turn-helix transcriptional regulator [Dehalococcoidia bacterium]